MKNYIRLFAVSAVAMISVGLGANKAEASKNHFSIGVNLGVPVVGAYLPPPAPVVVAAPVRYYWPERVRYYDYYDYRRGGHRHWHSYRDCRHDGCRHDRGWHRDGRRHRGR